MDQPYFMLKSRGESYCLKCKGPALRLVKREIEKAEIDQFGTWIRAYRRALPKNDPTADLVSLGREIFGWLDLDGNWFSELNDPRLEDEGFKGCRFEIDCRQLWARPLDPQCIA